MVEERWREKLKIWKFDAATAEYRIYISLNFRKARAQTEERGWIISHIKVCIGAKKTSEAFAAMNYKESLQSGHE
jgi:hypothetical protein